FRIPCLINNYEHTFKSYEGLALFYMSCYLVKKLNKLIALQTNHELKKQIELQRLEKKKLQDIHKKVLYEKKIIKTSQKEDINQNRIKLNQEKLDQLKNNIWCNVNKRSIKKYYDNSIKQYTNKLKIKKRGRPKQTSFSYC